MGRIHLLLNVPEEGTGLCCGRPIGLQYWLVIVSLRLESNVNNRVLRQKRRISTQTSAVWCTFAN